MVAILQHVATIPSVLPSDSSALEASISALQSSISALDNCIKTLEESSRPWELLAIVSSLLVFVGIVGEVVVIVWEYRDDLNDWRRGAIFWVWRVVHPPDRPPRWRFWLDIVATIFVLAGILGESWASWQMASINSNLRSKTSVLRAESDQLLSLITKEAGSAASNAKIADAAATDAEGKVGEVKKQVNDVGERAQRIDGALAMAQHFSSSREIRNPAEIKDAFSAFKGKAIFFRSYINDGDGYFLCEELSWIASDAGVDVKDQCAQFRVERPHALTTVEVFAPDWTTALALNKTLSASTLYGASAYAPNPGGVIVFVGRKPDAFVGGTAQTRDAAKRDAPAKK